MPLVDRQRRGYQIGEIRLGVRIPIPNKPGKFRPAKIEAFRFTTKSASVATEVAKLYGGEPREAELGNGQKTWEVMTALTEIAVMVPPGDQAISQWYELWSAEGCQRRCDGELEQKSQEACKCPSDLVKRMEMAKQLTPQACRPVTRINVILPDLPGLGVWKIESKGNNAADELAGTTEMLAEAQAQGIHIPATLRLEQRQSGKDKFVVPVLDVGATLRQLIELDKTQDITAALPPAPSTLTPIAALSTPSDPTVDLTALRDSLSKEGRDKLRPLWLQQFKFSTSEVPAKYESSARALIESCEDEPIDAELLDPGRPFV